MYPNDSNDANLTAHCNKKNLLKNKLANNAKYNMVLQTFKAESHFNQINFKNVLTKF